MHTGRQDTAKINTHEKGDSANWSALTKNTTPPTIAQKSVVQRVVSMEGSLSARIETRV